MKIQTIILLLLFNLVTALSYSQGDYLGVDKASGNATKRLRIYKGDKLTIILKDGYKLKGELQEITDEFIYVSDVRVRFDEIDIIKSPRNIGWLTGLSATAAIGSGTAILIGFIINGSDYKSGPWGPVFVTSVAILTFSWLIKNKRYKIKTTEQIKILNTTPVATETDTETS